MREILLYTTVLPTHEMLGVTFRDTVDHFTPPCTLVLDQSTHMGFSIWDKNNSLVLFGVLDKEANVSVTTFKFEAIPRLETFIEQFQINRIIIEDVYLQHVDTYETLLYIKHSIEDLGHLKGIPVGAVPTKKWKQILARPNKFNATDEKAEVRKYVEKAYPLLFTGKYSVQISEDMVDSIGMGLAMLVKYGRTQGIESLLRYNKKLAIKVLIFTDMNTPLKEQILSSRKKIVKQQLEADGLFELDADKHTNVYNGFRQFLTHRDGVAAIELTPKHREWGYFILEQNLTAQDLAENMHFWAVAYRTIRK